MAMIETLTTEQKEQLAVYRDKWINIGLCTKLANRKEAEEGVKIAYQAAGLPPPQHIIWTRSPLENCIVAVILKNLDVLKNKIRSDKGIMKLVGEDEEKINEMVRMCFPADIGKHLPLEEEL